LLQRCASLWLGPVGLNAFHVGVRSKVHALDKLSITMASFPLPLEVVINHYYVTFTQCAYALIRGLLKNTSTAGMSPNDVHAWDQVNVTGHLVLLYLCQRVKGR
jgi:hypothetical protein